MKWPDFLSEYGRESIIESAWLQRPGSSSAATATQLSRWVRAGKLIQLRRGLYLIAPPYATKRPHRFTIANRMVDASYVSLQAALTYHGLIPETVFMTTSVTTLRPNQYDTDAGSFLFRHIRTELFFGYEVIEVSHGQTAFVATPEKALLDLVYLTPGGDRFAYLEGLRLQNTEDIDGQRLSDYAARTGSPKLIRAAKRILEITITEAETWVLL